MHLKEIIQKSGIEVTEIKKVGGGDINDAYCLTSTSQKYFLKVNDALRYPQMFNKEANGLMALQMASDIIIPKPLQCGEIGNRQFLILEWIEKGVPGENFWTGFGSALAEMHQKPQTFFGFNEDNYIGSLHQDNSKHDSWASFYAECRILPLMRRLRDTGDFDRTEISKADFFCRQLGSLFPQESPSLLHGDLWSGNYMIADGGKASFFDPAVYYGHREMDLGMTLLFGGFSSGFYTGYNDKYPLEKNWRQRINYTQLYPLLVHAILFGGHYLSSVRGILKEFG